jgi:predicted kinase
MITIPSSQSGNTVINPDDFLETDAGRVWTPERNIEAWRCAFAALERILAQTPGARVIVVCGLQGAGKSTWIADRPPQPDRIYFDAALPGTRHRRPIIDIALSAGTIPEAVWIRASLATALAQNVLRDPDKQVPETSISSVHDLFEPPTIEEGFESIHVIDIASPPGAGPALTVI